MDKIKIIRLRDIYSKEYSTGKYIKLSKHGYYLSLVKNDRKIFENFVKHSAHQIPCTYVYPLQNRTYAYSPGSQEAQESG